MPAGRRRNLPDRKSTDAYGESNRFRIKIGIRIVQCLAISRLSVHLSPILTSVNAHAHVDSVTRDFDY